MISQPTISMRSLTHGQTSPTPLEGLDNTRYSLRTCLRKNIVILLKKSQEKKKSRNGYRVTIPHLRLITIEWEVECQTEE